MLSFRPFLLAPAIASVIAAPSCERSSAPEGVPPKPQDAGGPSSAARSLWFADVALETGLVFNHCNGGTGDYLLPEITGSGCAFLDYDHDGDLDVYLLQGEILQPGKSEGQLVFPPKDPVPRTSRLFRNELIRNGVATGSLRFVDVTTASGVGVAGFAMGVATGDYDNDGDVDLFVSLVGPDVLLENNGDGAFSEVTARAGVGDPRWNSSATFFDYDRDGFLDLFVCGYCEIDLAHPNECYAPTGSRDYCNPKAFVPLTDRLYRNRGDGAFEDVSAKCGILAAYGHALGVVAGDFDGNGWLDLYVANDGDANQMWLNQSGVFTDVALANGAAVDETGAAEAGMGLAAADVDDDGDLDILSVHLRGETNTFYSNRGRAIFEDVTARLGLAQSSTPFTSFGVALFDADHDADLDCFIAHGDVRMMPDQIGKPYPYLQTDQFMLNDGGRFKDISDRVGEIMRIPAVSRGLAAGDIDNDGDLDLLVSNNNGSARLLLNQVDHDQNWLLLRVIDDALRRDAYGARVELTLSDGRRLTRFVATDGSFCSAHDPRIHFAWPASIKPVRLRVSTLDGRVFEPPIHIGTLDTIHLPASEKSSRAAATGAAS